MAYVLLPPLVPAPSTLAPDAAPPWNFPELPSSVLSPDWLGDFKTTILGLLLWGLGLVLVWLVQPDGFLRSLGHISRHAGMVTFAIGLGTETYSFYKHYSESQHWNDQVYQEWAYLLEEPTLSFDFDPSKPKDPKEYKVRMRTWPRGTSKRAIERTHTLYATPEELAVYQPHRFVVMRRLSHAPAEKASIFEVIEPDGTRLSVLPWRINRDEVLSRKDFKRFKSQGHL